MNKAFEKQIHTFYSIRICFLVILFLLLIITAGFSQITLSGTITDSTGNGIAYANLQVSSDKVYTLTTDSLGYFIQRIHKKGKVQIRAAFINYSAWDSTFRIAHDTAIAIVLKAKPETFKEVMVVAGRRNENNNVMIRHNDYALKSKNLGETDIVSLLQQKTGIIHSSEISPGLYVRGMQQGNTGIFYSQHELFGTNHMLSIYPQFNSDAVSNARLIKADFEPRFGGYISSYLLVEPDHQQVNRFGGSAETGVLTTKFALKVPVIKDKISARISFRRSYFDLIAKTYNDLSKNKDNANKLSLYGFRDVNASIIYQTEKKGTLTLDFLNTYDKIEFDNTEFSLASEWRNNFLSAGWEMALSPKADFKFSTAYTGFKLNADFSFPLNRIIKNFITQANALVLFSYRLSPNLKNEAGLDLKISRLKLDASNIGLKADESLWVTNQVPSHNIAVFENIQWFATSSLKFKAGFRFETFNSDTTFLNLLPYLSATWDLKGYSINLSYSRQIQYKHLYVPTGINLPLNIWYPSQSSVPPEKADHYNLSLSKNVFRSLQMSFSAYYIHLTDLTEFLEGNYFTSLEFVTDIGRGYSYGAETGLIWKTKNFDVECGYTYSQSKRKFQSVNNGAWFSPSFDVRHKGDINIVYRHKEHWIFTLSQFVQDGFIITLPTSIYLHQTADVEGNRNYSIVPVYTTRYNFRMPLSHRMDVSAAYNFNWAGKTAGLVFGVYNVYNYQNPYFIYFTTVEKENRQTFLQAKKKSLLPVVPFISFKIAF